MQRFGDVSKEIKRVRKQMEEDEQLASLMHGLHGQNLHDDKAAVSCTPVSLHTPYLIQFGCSTCISLYL